MAEIWMLQTKRADFDGIARQFGIDPVTARVIRNRGIEGRENIERYLYGDLDSLYSPWLLKDMRPAVDMLKRKLK